MYSGGSAGRGENHFLSSSRTVTAVMAVCNVELIKVTNTGGTKKNIRGTKKNTQVTETGGTKKNTQGTGCVRLYQLGQLLILLVWRVRWNMDRKNITENQVEGSFESDSFEDSFIEDSFMG